MMVYVLKNSALLNSVHVQIKHHAAAQIQTEPFHHQYASQSPSGLNSATASLISKQVSSRVRAIRPALCHILAPQDQI